jgi:hypothetical protein
MMQLFDVYMLKSKAGAGQKGDFILRASWSLVCQILKINGLEPDRLSLEVLEKGHAEARSEVFGGVLGCYFWIEPIRERRS